MKHCLMALCMLALTPGLALGAERFAFFKGEGLASAKALAKKPDPAFHRFVAQRVKAQAAAAKRDKTGGMQVCDSAEDLHTERMDLDGDGKPEGVAIYPGYSCNGGNYYQWVMEVYAMGGAKPKLAGTVSLGTKMVGTGSITRFGKGTIRVDADDAADVFKGQTYRYAKGRLK